MPDPRPDDRRLQLDPDVTPVDTDTDGDGVSDRDEVAAGSDPHDPGDVPIDLGSLPDSPRDEPAAPTEPVVPNKEFWEQHYAREVQPDGSVIVTPRSSYDAPAAYTGKVADMKRDSDGDGLTDWQEFQRRTDPNNPDTDGDGRSDGDEFAQGFDPTTPTPPNATLDDQDGDGISDLDEIQFGGGGGFTIDAHAAAGLGTDGTQVKDKYYETHKTGDPVGDAALREELGQQLTPNELDKLTTAIGDDLFGDSAIGRARAEGALAHADGRPLDPAIQQAANDELVRNAQDAVADALAHPTAANVLGALRQDQMLGGGLLNDAQRGALEGAAADLLNPGARGSTTSQPGTGRAGTGSGIGSGTTAGAGNGPLASGDASGGGTGFDPGADGHGGGHGSNREPDGGSGGAADTPSQPTPGAGAPIPPTPTPPAGATPGGASTPDTSSVDPVGAGGSRGTEPSSSGMGIGPLNTTPGAGGTPGASGTPGSGATPGAGGGSSSSSGPANDTSSGAGPAVPIMSKDGNSIDHFERKNADGSTTIMTADGDEAYTLPPSSDGSDASSSTDDGSNSDAGSTDDDSDNNDDDSDNADDNSDLPDDGDSGEATAWVDDDAAGGIGSAGADFAGLTRGDFMTVAGGSAVDVRFTNIGGPDSPGTGPDTTGAVVVPTAPGGETPQDDATDLLGFRELDVSRVPGAFVTDVRPDLVERMPTLDPSTLNPDLNPHAHIDTAALAVGSGAMAIDTADTAIGLDAPMELDVAIEASVGFAELDDGQDFGAGSDFAVALDAPDLGGPGLMGFDGDVPDDGDGMFGGPDGGPMP